MPSPKDIKKAILKQAKTLDIPPKEAARVGALCAKHMAAFYADRKMAKSVTRGISAVRVKAITDKRGKKTLKVTSGELKCMPRSLKRKLKKDATLMGLAAKFWAMATEAIGPDWEEQLRRMPGSGGGIRG